MFHKIALAAIVTLVATATFADTKDEKAATPAVSKDEKAADKAATPAAADKAATTPVAAEHEAGKDAPKPEEKK